MEPGNACSITSETARQAFASSVARQVRALLALALTPSLTPTLAPAPALTLTRCRRRRRRRHSSLSSGAATTTSQCPSRTCRIDPTTRPYPRLHRPRASCRWSPPKCCSPPPRPQLRRRTQPGCQPCAPDRDAQPRPPGPRPWESAQCGPPPTKSCRPKRCCHPRTRKMGGHPLSCLLPSSSWS